MKPRKTELWVARHEVQPVRIVADAAVSMRGSLGGRLVPLVILDTSERPDIDELVRIHQVSRTPGDVEVQWAERHAHDGHIALILTFIRPFETMVIMSLTSLPKVFSLNRPSRQGDCTSSQGAKGTGS